MNNKDVVRLQLEEILASRLFSGKKQASNFLAYIVNETLEGRGERITQYAIAIEALGKLPDYCPTENPAVRVEAGRVRKLLQAYYEGEGWGSEVQFVLPTGSYVPEFKKISVSEHSRTSDFNQPRSRSVGPKVYIACPNPLYIVDEALRKVANHLRSSLPMVLGNYCEVEIALANYDDKLMLPGQLDSVWEKYQAEFAFDCSLDTHEAGGFSITGRLFHVLTSETVWTGSWQAELSGIEEGLESINKELVAEVFSLYKGKIFRFWSQYWLRQDSIPEHYQVMVTHTHLVQNSVTENSFQDCLRVCQRRIMHYPDDAAAYLHYVILCLYSHMFQFDIGEPLDEHWSQMALKALELNPGSAMAHAAFALSCNYSGDKALSEVEMEVACRNNPYDNWAAILIAVGMCAMGEWQRGFVLLKDYIGGDTSYPDPFRTLPCLSYFRGGAYFKASREVVDGLWQSFGSLVTHCQMGDCKGCSEKINDFADRQQLKATSEAEEQEIQDVRWLWERSQQGLNRRQAVLTSKTG